MIGFVLLLSSLILLGGAAGWWLHHRPRQTGPTPPVSVLVNGAEDLVPGSGGGDGKNGLAAFYAYQITAGKIHRGR